jgi:Tfp pilus assembly protein PilN
MINLLPTLNKEELKQEEQWKLVMILGILVLAVLICFSLILFSIEIFISGEVETQKILLNQKEKELENPKIQTLKENLITLNQTFSQLDSFYQNQFSLTEILEKISQTLPAGTYLTNLSIVHQPEKEGKGKMNCSLSGFASSREILLEFKENLEKEERFQEIYFPPANWVKPTDINFTVNFKIK